ncbi:hypothetical protein O3P69_003471 [Scylla paramamosain]|uniref:Uncharacterized protein n=1 Tax=Scylla paramamosain TaxID=85552 RepID=A0AAW0UGY3_SCYPA
MLRDAVQDEDKHRGDYQASGSGEEAAPVSAILMCILPCTLPSINKDDGTRVNRKEAEREKRKSTSQTLFSLGSLDGSLVLNLELGQGEEERLMMFKDEEKGNKRDDDDDEEEEEEEEERR